MDTHRRLLLSLPSCATSAEAHQVFWNLAAGVRCGTDVDEVLFGFAALARLEPAWLEGAMRLEFHQVIAGVRVDALWQVALTRVRIFEPLVIGVDICDAERAILRCLRGLYPLALVDSSEALALEDGTPRRWTEPQVAVPPF